MLTLSTLRRRVMLTVITSTRRLIVVQTLWKGSAPLTTAGLLMIAALAAAVVGMAIDPRIVTGAPVWLKPAKFAVSNAIYMFTLAWIFTVIPEWTWTRRLVGWTTAVILVMETAIIGLQAFRGTTSHFNVATLFDGILFGVMGVGILVWTLSTIVVAGALWRHQLPDRALGWALRLGMTITIVGAMSGGLMTQPTRQQLDAAQAGQRMAIAGAHTVGAPDGGPGLIGTGWSTGHGDLRVPHFLGLHALQLLPLVSLLLVWIGISDSLRVRLTIVAAASYVSLFAILLSQALRGQSLVEPDQLTVTLLGVWVVAPVTAAAAAALRLHPTSRPAIATSIQAPGNR